MLSPVLPSKQREKKRQEIEDESSLDDIMVYKNYGQEAQPTTQRTQSTQTVLTADGIRRRRRYPNVMIYASKFKLHHWPIVTVAWYVLTFIISYSLAVYNGHVIPFLPYISDTGGVPPESCIMGQMMNIGALLMSITIYIRYRQIQFIIDTNKVPNLTRLNKRTLLLGYLTAFGTSMVGNFPWTTIVSLHFVGAFMAFGLGYPFFVLQTKISYQLNKVYEKNPQYGIRRSLFLVRCFIVILYGICLTTTIIAGTMAFKKFEGENSTWWTPERDGYYIHLVSAFSEWFILLCFLAYTLSGAPEFRLLEFEEIKFRQKIPNTNSSGDAAVQTNHFK